MNDLIERLEHAMANTGGVMQAAAIRGEASDNLMYNRIFSNQVLIMNALVLILRRQSNEDKQVLG